MTDAKKPAGGGDAAIDKLAAEKANDVARAADLERREREWFNEKGEIVLLDSAEEVRARRKAAALRAANLEARCRDEWDFHDAVIRALGVPQDYMQDAILNEIARLRGEEKRAADLERALAEASEEREVARTEQAAMRVELDAARAQLSEARATLDEILERVEREMDSQNCDYHERGLTGEEIAVRHARYSAWHAVQSILTDQYGFRAARAQLATAEEWREALERLCEASEWVVQEMDAALGYVRAAGKNITAEAGSQAIRKARLELQAARQLLARGQGGGDG